MSLDEKAMALLHGIASTMDALARNNAMEQAGQMLVLNNLFHARALLAESEKPKEKTPRNESPASVEELLKKIAGPSPNGIRGVWHEEANEALRLYRAEREAAREREEKREAASEALRVANRNWLKMHDELFAERDALKARINEAAEILYQARIAWGDGPPTMKTTADWANRWIAEFRRANRILRGEP